MKSFFKCISITIFLFIEKAEAKILIQFDNKNIHKKEFVIKHISGTLGVPKELIEMKKVEECIENQQFDIVICLNKKNGEKLTFPTVKNFLIKNKYDFFKKN